MKDMDRQQLFLRNERLIQMVIERAKRDFPRDIAVIGLTGSFGTGDYHAKSDLDLIIINNTDRGWGISSCFILDDIGYDVYCTPWETRIEDQANLESPMMSCLLDLKILYCATPADLEKLNSYRQRALDALAKPIGTACISRAAKWIDRAKQEYTNTLLNEDTGAVRYAASEVVYNLVNALAHLNNTYFKRGIKRYLEEIGTFRYIPEGFGQQYMAVIDAKTMDEIRSASLALLRSTTNLYQEMYTSYIIPPVPDSDSLKGTYEEMWCNYRNKVLASVDSADKSYAYLTAMGAQNFLNEMTEFKGTPKFDLMRYFDSDQLHIFRDQFLQIMDQYLEEYNKAGRAVERFDTFEQLYDQYMKE